MPSSLATCTTSEWAHKVFNPIERCWYHVVAKLPTPDPATGWRAKLRPPTAHSCARPLPDRFIIRSGV